MAFDNRDVEIPSPIISMENFYAQNLGPKRKKICEILKTFSDDAVSIYLAGIAALEIPDFPAQQSVVGHCFRELINAIIRSDESVLKNQVLKGLQSVEFIQNSEKTETEIFDVINIVWDKIKSLNNEKAKLKKLFIDRNLQNQKELLFSNSNGRREIENNINSVICQVLSAKGVIDKLRHCGKNFYTISTEQLCEKIDILENYILQLEDPTYIKQKEMLDEILETANS